MDGGYGARVWPQPGAPPGAASTPDSPNCPPALASAPSLLLPNCMSESRVRGDMGRSMVLLKEVLSEGGRGEEEHRKLGIRAWPGLSDTPSSPRRAPGLGTAGPSALQRKGAAGGEARAGGLGSEPEPGSAPAVPSARTGSLTAPGRNPPRSDEAEHTNSPPTVLTDTPETLTG